MRCPTVIPLDEYLEVLHMAVCVGVRVRRRTERGNNKSGPCGSPVEAANHPTARKATRRSVFLIHR